jgi:DNA (cytosine-5)-methyltransferase 1
VTTGGHHGIVECVLSSEQTEGAERVAAFMMRFYSEGGQWSDLRDPMTTVTTKDRMGLVAVTIKGTPYVIVDIGLRMLEPRELFRAQDFPDSYIIDRGHDGRKFSKSTQVRMVGNSVNPMMAVGFLSLNAPHLAVQRKVA